MDLLVDQETPTYSIAPPRGNLPDHGSPAWNCDNDHTGCLWNDGHNTCMLDDDDDELASTTCGYIYGHGGWHRYYLRLDGYVYFSEKHAHEPAISNAKALGFRIN